MTVRQASAEREDVYRKSVAPLTACIERIAAAIARGDEGGHAKALGDFARYMGQTLSICALLGARRTLLLARAQSREGANFTAAHFATAVPALVPAVPFLEAIEDLVSREPKLAQTWKEVSALYNREHAFALAKSADIEITKRVQRKVAQAIEEGGERGAVRRAIMDLGPFTEDYADNVFRTNAATAYTAGTFKQAQDPDVAEVMPAFEFTSARDVDVRKNHRAADGLVAATHDPIWDTFAPPIGYRCRCSIDLVSKYELDRRGLLGDVGPGGFRAVVRRFPSDFANASPDKNFRTGGIAMRING